MEKKIFIILILFSFNCFCQLTNYTFSTISNTYSEINGGSTIGDQNSDDLVYVNSIVPPINIYVGTGDGFNIGFPFRFNGIQYDRFGLSPNGWIKLGKATLNPAVNMNTTNPFVYPLNMGSPNSTNTDYDACITGFGADLVANASSEIRYQTIGTAPNRTLIIQWKNYSRKNIAIDLVSYQIRLNESDNSVHFAYNCNLAITATQCQVGIRASPTNYAIRKNTTTWNTSTTGTSLLEYMNVSSTNAPSNSTTLAFTPAACGILGFTNTGFSNITQNSALFTWNSYIPLPVNGIQYTFSTSNAAPTDSYLSTTSNTINFNNLTPSTSYYLWARYDCGYNLGSWTGPFAVTTACGPETNLPWTENFSTTPSGINVVPNCWAYQTPFDFGIQNEYLYAAVGTQNRYVWTKGFQLTAGVPYDLNLKIKGDGFPNRMATFYANTTQNSSGAVQVGLPYTAPEDFNFYPVSNVFVPQTSGVYYFGLNAFHGAPNSSSNSPFGFDDFEVKVSNLTPPPCPTNIVATTNTTCGNELNTLTWNASLNALGYKIQIGTTPNGNDIANDVSTTNLTYSFIGNINTTYYYKVKPFSYIGTANCVEQSFTTITNGCYCVSNPAYNIGNGISNVQIATTNFATPDVTYYNHTANMVTIDKQFPINMQITNATGTNLEYKIWIDFNNDSDFFDAGELVNTFNGLTSLTVLDATFTLSNLATLGNHRMRVTGITNINSLNSSSSPCYNGVEGITLDFTVNIIDTTCQPPVATYTIVPNCTNNNYTVNINVTNLGNGSPILVYNSINLPITTLGPFTIGPFANTTSFSMVLQHGSDNLCNLNFGNITFTCAPINDNLCNAINLPIGQTTTGSQYTLIAATIQSGETAPICFFNSGIPDTTVWFSFIAPNSGNVTVTTDFGGGTLGNNDTELAVYNSILGTCNEFNVLGSMVDCNQDGTSFAAILTLNNLVAGNKYYIQLDNANGFDAPGTFGIQVIDNAPLHNSEFQFSNLKTYPNPVNDILTIDLKTEISEIKIINLLGQPVKSIKNATKINVSDLENGVYLLEIYSNNKIYSSKIIKN